MARRHARERATIEDLYLVDGKAELIGGEVVHVPPTGFMPGSAAVEIVASLRGHALRTRTGRAIGDNVGFRVDLPERGSFSPDAAYWTGPTSGMKFLDGAPTFAVEVRSEGDYGAAAERAMAAKRADYFAAGTLVVWDVDLLDPIATVRVHETGRPDAPRRFGRGETADAGDAVPGWSMPVDALFADIEG